MSNLTEQIRHSNKRSWIVMVIAIIVLTTCLATITALAAGESTIAVGSATLEEGQTSVTLPVTISSNPGFAGFTLKVTCDSDLTFTGVQGELIPTSQLTVNTTGGYVQFMSAADVTGNGTLFNLTFAVNENATAGDKAVSVAIADDDLIANAEEQDISASFTFTAGAVTVPGSPQPAGYLTYNGTVIPDAVIASCLNANGDAMLTEVLAAMNIEPTGDCYYSFDDGDGYVATLRAELLPYMLLFDGDGVEGAPYAWRNSLTDTAAANFTGSWYKVKDLTTITSGDHHYNETTNTCDNQISTTKNAFEPCGAEQSGNFQSWAHCP